MNDYLFPKKRISFEELFPQIKDIKIEIIVLRGGGREVKSINYSKENFPGSGIKCYNPSCENGGLSERAIPSLIKGMVSTNNRELKEHKFCNGGLYRGRNRYNDCGWSFDIKISIRYS